MALETNQYVKLWGVIQNEIGEVLIGVEVKLLKKEIRRKRAFYTVIQRTFTDIEGKYKFEISKKLVGNYQIVVVEQK
ncbi:MAG: hypothetical protein ACRC1P_05630 [Cellulosilyticaceae bacterium]